MESAIKSRNDNDFSIFRTLPDTLGSSRVMTVKAGVERVSRRPAGILAAIALAALIATPSMARPPELEGRIEAPSPLGASTFSKLIWTLYDAELWDARRRAPQLDPGPSRFR